MVVLDAHILSMFAKIDANNFVISRKIERHV